MSVETVTTVSKELVAASSKPILLSIIAKGETYGYEIIQKVRVLSGERLQWTDGMLYPVLHRLERTGLISSRWGASEAGRRRKYYGITSEGRKVLARELEHWMAVDATVSLLQERVGCLSF
jgi:DNA-binding PadR family transcriptional regulator